MTTSTSLPFSFNPLHDPTHFHCIRYIGPPLKDANFDKSALYYLFKYNEKAFVSPLAFTWTDGNEARLLLPFWMKNFVRENGNDDEESCGKMSFMRIELESLCEFDGTVKVEFDGLKPPSSPSFRFPFEEILPELLGSKRPLSRNGTVIPLIYQGARYLLKFTPKGCGNEVFWFNLERGTLDIIEHSSVMIKDDVHVNLFINGSWSEEYKILKYQLENTATSSKEAFLLCGIPLPLQKELLKGIIDYEKADLSSFISEEHLQVAEEIDHQVDSQAQTPGFLLIEEAEKISKNLITEILRQCKHSKVIFTTSARSIESSNHLIELEKAARRFNFQVINCNFGAIGIDEKMQIISRECGIDISEILKYKWALKSMNYVDLLRVCKQVNNCGLKDAIESVKERDNAKEVACTILQSQGATFKFFGYKEIREELKSLIKGPLMNPEAYDRFNLPKSSGFLLHGPPGCGKTALCLNILTSEPFRNLFTVLHVPSASQLLSKYFGETEANIRRLFAFARERKPAILFIDQIECLGLKRGTTDSNNSSNERYLSTLLNEMDGISGNEGVTIIACANDIEMLDEALLRPGRLDRHFYLGLPEKCDREEIIKGIVDTVNVEELIERTEGMTGAEIKSILRNK